jgi:D-arabinan exo alpha-(1,3)/(1,5)-arabinofuranosidase (non-reducing end)
MQKLLVLIGILLVSIFNGAKAEEYTYVDLIGQLTDLERLAVLPAAGEKCQQWSSYDRASKYDAAANKYIAWTANGDGNGIIRKEGNQQVFAEIKGPGVIWRIWSALANQGHVKIYLDGNPEPAVDLPFIGYFDRKHKPFIHPALVHMTARGQNNYVPISFGKSCKIVGEGDWGRYYHFTYTTYPEGTKLPTFRMELTSAETAALDEASEILAAGNIDPAGRREGQISENKIVTIEPGRTVTISDITGPRAIMALKVKLNVPEAPECYDVLRELALSIYWDGESKPSVWSPLGDFFGTAVGENLYKSLPLGMTEDGYYSYWYMPFGKNAKVQLTNDGKEARSIKFEIIHAPLSRPVEQLGRFHAKWHRDAFLPPEPERKAIDWTMLTTEGRGRFCGVMLHVWNPRGSWWGEGDEKFYIDGEKFPSTFGTGSEDYFGYAWCNPELFANCYHNQTISMNNRGHISVNRWHIGDNIPFQTFFEGAIEKYYPNSRPTLYAAISYWYLAPGGKDPYAPQPIDQRKGYWGEIKIFKVKGALEGEKLKIESKTGGQTRPQDLSGFGAGWSGESHLWWTDAKPGDKLELILPVKTSSTYRLNIQLTKAIDYGIVQFHLDGKKIRKPVDLYNNGVIPTGKLDMGVYDLTKGNHKLTVEITGCNPKAVKAYMFGLDYILLDDIKAGFYLPENPDYTILDSARDSVNFAVFTLEPYRGKLRSKSSFVKPDGSVMGWHDFGNLEGPGWAANAVGGAYEIYRLGATLKKKDWQDKALLLLDHVLQDGFVNYKTGFITGYRDTVKDQLCLNYKHNSDWFCAGSMAKVAYQMIIFGDILKNPRKERLYRIATENAQWIHLNVKLAGNGWIPRRSTPEGEHYRKTPEGGNEPLFEKSGDGLFVIQLYTALTQRGLADYRKEIKDLLKVFMDAGGIFGSMNHDTYDENENVCYSVAFRVLRQAAKLLDDDRVQEFAYEKCLKGLDQFKMIRDRNGVKTKGLLYMERTWDTSYLWENAEASLAYLEAYQDTKKKDYLYDGLTILRAAAKHHHGPHGFMTEGVDWNNHVGRQHHFNQAEFGDIQYTEPLLNNMHIVEPTLLAIELQKN